MTEIITPLGAVLVSIATAIAALMSRRGVARRDALTEAMARVTLLEDEIKDHRLRLRKCEDAREELAADNLRLMRMALRLDP